jgi:hypothetical protein
MTLRRRLLPLVALAAAAACRDVADAGPAGPVSVLPREQWSGEEIRLSGAPLSGLDDAVVRVDTFDLLPTRVDDSTLAVRLPPLADGSYAVELRTDGRRFPLDPVSVRGFTGTIPFELSVAHELQRGPRNGHATVLAADEANVYVLDAARGTHVTYPGLGSWALRSPGVTPEEGVYLLAPAGSGGGLESWRLWPTPERIATHPVERFRQVMRLSAEAWVVTAHHDIRIQRRADATQPWTYERIEMEESEGVHMSPRGDRATVRVDFAPGGVPVFDAPRGTVAYRVPFMRRVEGVDFSADGEFLLLAGSERGYASTGPHHATLLRSATGEVVWDVATAGVPFAAALDPVRPYAYVGIGPSGTPADAHPSVLVLDVETGRVLGELRVPSEAPRCQITCYQAILVPGVEPAVYLVAQRTEAGPLSYRFRLPAATP